MSTEEPEETSPRPAQADDDEEAAEASPAPPRKRKKAAEPRARRKPRRTKASTADEEPARPLLRDDIPAFTVGFPSDPALDALVQAFEQGNYAHVRKEAPLLAKRTEQPEVRKAARELARRLDPDPIAVYLLLAATALLVFLAGWFWTHPHELP